MSRERRAWDGCGEVRLESSGAGELGQGRDDITTADGGHLLLATQSGHGYLSERLKGHWENSTRGEEGVDSENVGWVTSMGDEALRMMTGVGKEQWVQCKKHQQARDRTTAWGQQLGGLSKWQLWLNQNRWVEGDCQLQYKELKVTKIKNKRGIRTPKNSNKTQELVGEGQKEWRSNLTASFLCGVCGWNWIG